MAKRFSGPAPCLGGGNETKAPRSLVVLLVVAVGLFALGVREGDSGPLHAVRGVFQTVASPVRIAGSFVSSPIGGLGNVIGNLTADSATLSELRDENESLKAEVARLSEYQSDAETLGGLLQLRDTYKLTSTAARVISQSVDSWSSTITIDKGSSSGFAVGMAVTSANGVIGQISECGPTTSVVRLITDENSGVSAKVQPAQTGSAQPASEPQGQLVGSPDGTLRLTLVRTDQQVSVGDMVVTSGLGGTYPKGLPIGTVSNVTKTSGALYYDITVEALSSAGNLEEVLVITSVSDDQQATADDAKAADAQDRSAEDTASATAAATAGAAGSPATGSSDGQDQQSQDTSSGGGE